MTGSDAFIIDLMTSRGMITEAQAEEARKRADLEGISIIEALQSLNIIAEEEVMMMLAAEYGMETFDLKDYQIPAEVVAAVPAEVARRYKIMPVMKADNVLRVAMADPTDLETLDSLRYILKTDIEGVIASASQITEALNYHYGSTEESVESFLEDLTEGTLDVSELTGTQFLTQEEDDDDEDAPIIRLVSLIILEAFRTRSSDIHLEPLEKRFRVRYRIDGVLHEVENPPKYLQKNILSRL